MNRMKRRATLSVLTFAMIAMAGTVPALALGTPATTPITNQATVDYEDINGNNLQALSNIVTTIVSQVASVTVDPDRAGSGTPGDTLYYAHVVSNLGNGNDTIDLTAVSSNGWTTALYYDADASGTFTGGDTLLTDTDADTVVDTGSLAANGTLNILAAVTIPAGALNAVTDSMVVTGTSSFNTGVSDIATDTTTVNAPDLGVVKSVLPAGNQPPGTTLTYTMVVTNNGASNAANVELTDPIPGFTTYVPGSMTMNAVSQTDASDAPTDDSDYNVTVGGAVYVLIGTLAPSASATVTFQVTID